MGILLRSFAVKGSRGKCQWLEGDRASREVLLLSLENDMLPGGSGGGQFDDTGGRGDLSSEVYDCVRGDGV